MRLLVRHESGLANLHTAIHAQDLFQDGLRQADYRIKSQKISLHCVERNLLPKVHYSSTTHVHLLQWLHGKQQEHYENKK